MESPQSEQLNHGMGQGEERSDQDLERGDGAGDRVKGRGRGRVREGQRGGPREGEGGRRASTLGEEAKRGTIKTVETNIVHLRVIVEINGDEPSIIALLCCQNDQNGRQQERRRFCPSRSTPRDRES